MGKKAGRKSGGSNSSSNSTGGSAGGGFSTLDVDPRHVRYAHSKIKPLFSGCGRTIEQTLCEIRDGKIRASDLPMITVLLGPQEKAADGQQHQCFFSLNNRRLFVFKACRDEGLLGPSGLVRVRARPMKAHERERYTTDRCSLNAKFLFAPKPEPKATKGLEIEAQNAVGGGGGALSSLSLSPAAPVPSTGDPVLEAGMLRASSSRSPATAEVGAAAGREVTHAMTAGGNGRLVAAAVMTSTPGAAEAEGIGGEVERLEGPNGSGEEEGVEERCHRGTNGDLDRFVGPTRDVEADRGRRRQHEGGHEGEGQGQGQGHDGWRNHGAPDCHRTSSSGDKSRSDRTRDGGIRGENDNGGASSSTLSNIDPRKGDGAAVGGGSGDNGGRPTAWHAPQEASPGAFKSRGKKGARRRSGGGEVGSGWRAGQGVAEAGDEGGSGGAASDEVHVELSRKQERSRNGRR